MLVAAQAAQAALWARLVRLHQADRRAAATLTSLGLMAALARLVLAYLAMPALLGSHSDQD
jgi:hypothetical protein